MKNISFAVLAAAVVCVGAFAQGPPPGPPGHRGGFGAGIGMGMRPGKVIAGAPYSATITNSTTQTLQDGNTIQHTTNGSVARDSLGRTYEQLTVNGTHFGQNGPATLTFINDPVAGYAYTLNASTKVAFRRAIKTPPAGPPPGGAHPGGHRDGNAPDNADRVTTDLGTQVVGGVTATGKSVTLTVPAGAMGNSQPIVTTSETWFSPDLQIPVLAKRSDPRMGQTTYSLTNIQRAEPAASLFQVPSDYTIKDAPHFQGGPGAPAPPQQ